MGHSPRPPRLQAFNTEVTETLRALCVEGFLPQSTRSPGLEMIRKGISDVSNSVLQTVVNHDSQPFAENTRRMVDLLTEIKNEEERIRQGGGAKAVEAQRSEERRVGKECRSRW